MRQRPQDSTGHRKETRRKRREEGRKFSFRAIPWNITHLPAVSSWVCYLKARGSLQPLFRDTSTQTPPFPGHTKQEPCLDNQSILTRGLTRTLPWLDTGLTGMSHTRAQPVQDASDSQQHKRKATQGPKTTQEAGFSVWHGM